MEPSKKHQPNIEPDIRPDLGLPSRNNSNSPQAEALAASEQATGAKNAKDLHSNTIQGNQESIKNAESSRQGYWTGNSSSNTSTKNKLSSISNIAKKKGPLAALITIGLGLPSIIAILLSPALVIQQFAESLTSEFNDQLAAMDLRSAYLLKKKYSTTFTKGGCGTVTIRCKYQSIREGSGLAKRLNNAGVTIEGNRSIVPGRIKPTHFVFEGKEIKPENLFKEAKNNPSLRKALQKGYDPMYAAFSDRKSSSLRARLGIVRTSNVTSSTDKKKMNDDLKKTASGQNTIPENATKLTPVDSEGNPIDEQAQRPAGYVDENGTKYSVEQGRATNSLIDESIGRGNLADKVGKSATKASLKGALTATAFGAGAVDTACTAWVLIRVAGFAAKQYQQLQLMRYGYEFVKFSHKQKYGDATAEEMEFFADILTKTNSTGKAALDSDGYKFAAYGDVFKPGDFTAETKDLKKDNVSDADIEKILVKNETSRYVNGQLISTSLMSKIAGFVSASNTASVKSTDDACGFVKSWKGQALVFGLAAAGAITAFFSAGATVGPGAIAQGAVSIAISVTFALLQPKLIEMAKGEVISGDENGNEAGNAVASGMGGYNAQSSQARGLGVATQNTYSAYKKLSNEVAANYAKNDREERSPFDPTSKNTFIGSIVSSIIPYVTKTQTVGSATMSTLSFISSSFSSIGFTQKTSANSSKYRQCDDPEYKDRNLAADPFCNLRYAIPVADLNIDPDEVLDYMLEGGQNGAYIKDDDATPLGDYADYVAKCFDRRTSIGDGVTNYTDPDKESGGDPGDECIIGNGGEFEKRNSMFRLFYIDSSVQEGMEDDFSAEEATSSEDNTGSSDNLDSNYSTPSFDKNPNITVDEPGSRCTGGFTAGAQSLSRVIKNKWSLIQTIGGYSCRANTADPSQLSVHAVGRALDIMVNANTTAGLKAGNEIRNFLISNAEALGTQRVIWDRHIWSANVDGWRSYTGPNPHTDHIHAEINLEASRNASLGR